MRKQEEIFINGKTLKEIIENHKHSLYADIDGWKNMKANLSYADLRSADLRSADLSYADLSYADLRSADLSSADLRYADLRSADLSYANLSYADLRYANFRSANFSYADLRSADLSSANLLSANLRYADNLSETKNLYLPYACPDFGIFTGWKKASNKIVQLEIPEDAKRCSSTGRKCRCSKAKVLGIYDYDRNLLDVKEVCSDRDKNFIYKVGEIVSIENFNENRWEECTSGIHFFINFQEAVNYM